MMVALPIDYRRRPWRNKYIDEETPLLARWFLSGGYADGSVDICGPYGDVFSHVPDNVAARIMAARDAFCDAIIAEIGEAA